MQVVCGGAHTAVLGSKQVQKTAANPWGVVTVVACWGYGGNGQLGTGGTDGALIPVKARMPKWEIVTELSAGRSWTMARTVTGAVYTWGKGLRGQLGQRDKLFSLAPRKIVTFASMLRISSGYAHNVCISTNKKSWNEKVAERTALLGRQPFEQHIDTSLRKVPPEYRYSFDCCRRVVSNIFPEDKRIRFYCHSCGLESVCYLCAKLCHRNHKLTINAYEDGKTPFCECGVGIRCRLLPTITDVQIEDEDKCAELDFQSIRTIAANKIRKMAQLYVGKMRHKKAYFMRKQVRQDVCRQYFERVVMSTVWDHLQIGVGRFAESRERLYMAIEDNARKSYDLFFKMQQTLLCMDGILTGIKLLFGKASIQVTFGKVQHPTFAMCWRSLRYQQLRVHPSKRLSIAHIARRSGNFPRHDPTEGRYFDTDVCLLCRRFVRNEMTLSAQDRDRHRKIEKEIAIETKRLESAVKFTGSRAKLLTMAAHLQTLRESNKDRLAPSLKAMYSDEEGDQRGKGNVIEGKSMPHIVKRRRNSVGDPVNMYQRICRMRPNIIVRNFYRRRYSLPNDLRALRQATRPPWSYIASVENSLSLYETRIKSLWDFTDVDYSYIWLERSVMAKRRKLKKVLGYSWCTPRLPREALQRIIQPRRRNTIAEPERMCRQLKIMHSIRKNFQEVRTMARMDEYMPIRMRSFDPDEIYDSEDGVTESLGLEYESPLSVPSANDLHADQVRIEKRLVTSKWYMDFRAAVGAGPFIENVRRVPPPPPKGPPPNKPVVWQEHTADGGHVYYYNIQTGESRWEKPMEKNAQIQRMIFDESYGSWYWYNDTTGESAWVT